MDDVSALERSFDACAACLDEANSGRLDRSTPCEDWDLGTLAEHVVGTTVAFARVLRGGARPARARVPRDRATSTDLRAAAADVVAAWRDPAVVADSYDRVVELDDGVLIPPIALPGEMVRAINLLDIGVHAHDLASAVGRPDLAPSRRRSR